MSEQKHTLEPWAFLEGQGIMGRDGDPIATSPGHFLSDFRRPVGERSANAERIVDCVNACEGIDPKAVPAMLQALRYYADQDPTGDLEIHSKESGFLTSFNNLTEKARLAIAAATGEEAGR